MKIAIVDGDSIPYICSKDTVEESLSNVDSIIGSIMRETGSTHYYLFLSDGPYFRHDINPDYKSKRPPSKLRFLKTLKAYLRESYGGISYSKLEADDLVAFAAGSIKEPNEYVVCSIDKDVTNQIVGNFFNYKTYTTGSIDSQQAYYFLFMQTLMGDATDNITGIPKVGEVKAKNTLENMNTSEMLYITMEQYKKHFVSTSESIYEFQKNFRQVYLLRNPDDFLREVGYVPELPELRNFGEDGE